jgi:hypothetical protein
MLRQIIRHWLPLAAVITALCGLVYLASQQVVRLTGNDPQIQLAQDAAVRLSAGEPLASVVLTGTVDVGRSLAPFTIVYDDQGNVLAATGLLHGQPPALPSGVLDFVRHNGEDRRSWQPEPGARFAAVVERVSGAHPGFVLVARSLGETEQRVGVVEQLAVTAGLGALVVSLALVVFVEMVVAPRKAGV